MEATESTPCQAGDAAATPPPRRLRWLQFRLRTLLIAVGLCAVGAFLWRTIADVLPFREQRRTMALVEKLGGTYQTTAASDWHRRLFGSDLQNLVLVNLVDCDRADEFIGPVAGSPLIETLLVGGDAFGDEHLRRLHSAGSLRRLVLDSTSVTDEAIAALRAAQPKLEVCPSERRAIAALHKLGPSSTRARPVPPALESVVGPHFFDTFESGCFSNGCRDAQAANFRHLKHVHQLILGHSQITDQALAHVSDLQSLRVLRLSGRPIGDAGLAHLASLAKLEELTLRETPVTDAGVAHLEGLRNLRLLDLKGTRITDAGLAHLRGLTKLKSLNLDNKRVTPAAVEDLRAALPQCDISYSPARVRP